MRPELRGLYAVTSEALCRDEASLLNAVEAALRGGARLVQYRDKWNSPGIRSRYARALLALCRKIGARLIINDDVTLAAKIGADGVHLGASDASLAETRSRLGPTAIIGVSCGSSLARALAAEADGASYIAFGRFFPSRTKPASPPASLEFLRDARPQLSLPVCAIGGITPANAAEVIGAGADLVAAVEGIFAAVDIEAAARAYLDCFAVVGAASAATIGPARRG